MKVPYSWLADLVDIANLTPQQIANGLTNAGLEVEEIENRGPVFTQVVVAQVDAVEPHPNADKLRLVTVNKGPELGTQKVVCGAPNVRQGIRIAFALDGAQVLNRKTGETFVLGTAVIRGVESSGMVCSIDELGLNEQYESTEDGIWVLDTLTSANDVGRPLEEVLGLPKETVLHVMPTANRGDWMSMVGVAREVAAVFGRDLKAIPSIETHPLTTAETASVAVELPDTDVCRYYALAHLQGVQIGPSPQVIQDRLSAAGIRCINNVVDVTNYVMLLTGQPMHAFDKAKLSADGSNNTISARRAKPGETLATLDGQTLTLHSENVLITHNDTPIALAGVMGGQDSAIDDTTTDIILEVAYFPSATTRRSARAANGLRSESSARFERGVDPAGQETAFHEAIHLIQDLSGAKLVGSTVADKRVAEKTDITLSLATIERVLGIFVPKERLLHALTVLGFSVSEAGDTVYRISIPSYRQGDVKHEIDLVEEIIRIYGYEHLPLTLPQVDVVPETSFRQLFIELVRREIQALGLSEAMTLSLVAEAKTEAAVHLQNSHSREHTVMRETLLDGLFDVVADNVAKGNPNVALFELGRRYALKNASTPPVDLKDTGVSETLCLAGALTGIVSSGGDRFKPDPACFYTAKGILEGLFQALGIASGIKFAALSENPLFHPGRAAEIKLGKTAVGLLGQVHPLTTEDAKIKTPVFLFELNLDVLLEASRKAGLFAKTTQPISAFPSVERDLAFLAPLELTHQKILATLKQLNQPLLLGVNLFDEYQGAQIEAGHRSLAYRLTLGSSDRTLTDADIEGVVTQVKDALNKQLQIQLR